jgi:hypothetical protein
MATTCTFHTNTPHSVVASAAGTGGLASVSRATLLAACAAGPLWEALTRIPDWSVLNLGGALCKAVHVREVVQRSALGEATAFEFFWTAAGFDIDCTGAFGSPGVCQLEIRLSHTERA